MSYGNSVELIQRIQKQNMQKPLDISTITGAVQPFMQREDPILEDMLETLKQPDGYQEYMEGIKENDIEKTLRGYIKMYPNNLPKKLEKREIWSDPTFTDATPITGGQNAV